MLISLICILIYSHNHQIQIFSYQLIASDLLIPLIQRQSTPLTVIIAISLRLRHNIVKSRQPLQTEVGNSHP